MKAVQINHMLSIKGPVARHEACMILLPRSSPDLRFLYDVEETGCFQKRTVTPYRAGSIRRPLVVAGEDSTLTGGLVLLGQH